MLNRANKRFKKTLTSGATADDLRAEPGQFAHVLADGEGVHHVCSSIDGIEHETETRTSTMEPGGDADAHLLVTDRRVLGVLGSDIGEPEFSLDAWTITRAKGRESLLSATIEVATADATVRFDPDDGTEVEAVAATIERVAGAWDGLYTALAAVDEAIEEYEERVDRGVDPDSALTNVRSRLSRAHHCATKGDAVPDDVMLEEVEPVADRVDRLRVSTRLERIERLLDEAESLDAEDPSPLIEAAFIADGELADAREVHGEVGSTSISQRITDLTARVDTLCESILTDAQDLCDRATDASDPETALPLWETATERYRTMLEVGWNGKAGASAAALRFQLAWIVGNRIDALRARADALEAAGDDDEDNDGEDDGTEQYEAAIEFRKEARSIEAQCPFAIPGTDSGAIDRLEDKVARSEWQWGKA